MAQYRQKTMVICDRLKGDSGDGEKRLDLKYILWVELMKLLMDWM